MTGGLYLADLLSHKFATLAQLPPHNSSSNRMLQEAVMLLGLEPTADNNSGVVFILGRSRAAHCVLGLAKYPNPNPTPATTGPRVYCIYHSMCFSVKYVEATNWQGRGVCGCLDGALAGGDFWAGAVDNEERTDAAINRVLFGGAFHHGAADAYTLRHLC